MLSNLEDPTTQDNIKLLKPDSRKLVEDFLSERRLPEELNDDPTLRAKAKDRWYVPDPNKAGDLEKLRERALLR